MSQATDELEGFLELLAATGQTLAFGAVSFRGLVKRLQPATEEYDLTPNDDDSVMISALREDLPAAALKVGAGLSDAAGYHYRVTRLHRSPGSLIARLECIALNP
jgi:hypothetical protein